MKELAHIITMPFSIISERSWQPKEAPEDWEEADGTPSIKGKRVKKEDPGNYRTINFTSASGKAVAQILLTLIFKHMKDKTMGSRVYQGQNLLS